MEITNEEMEVLNRAIEILSKHVYAGAVDKDTFDLFENLIISAIDTKVPYKTETRRELHALPFSRFLLSYLIGYYDNDSNGIFHGSPDIINFEVKSDFLSFEMLSKETKEILKSIDEFTIAPELVAVKDDEAFSLVSYSCYEAGDNLEFMSEIKDEKINAPIWKASPLVFECKKISFKDDIISSKLDAKILKIDISDTAINTDGEFDIISAWKKMRWSKF